MTATGTVYGCLGHDQKVELRDLLRSGGACAVEAALDALIAGKPRRHDFRDRRRAGGGAAHERDRRLMAAAADLPLAPARGMAGAVGGGLLWTAVDREVRRRPVEPDLPDRCGERVLCASAQAVRADPALGACGRARASADRGAVPDRLPGAAALRAVRGSGGDRRALLHHGHGRGPHLLERAPARAGAGRAAGHLRGDDPHAGAAAQHRSRRDRARRLWRRRQLFRAAGEALDQAISRRGDGADRGSRAADRFPSAHRAGAGPAFDHPRRLSDRQHHLCAGLRRG